MRTYIAILIVLFFTISCSSIGKREIPGSEMITDKEFKRVLLKYLALDEKLDYEKIYNYLSKGYLKRHFPNIKNAEEYKKEMKNTSERGTPKYLEISVWKKVNDSKYSVEIISEENAEGILTRFKEIFYFVNENGAWKLDDLELKDDGSVYSWDDRSVSSSSDIREIPGSELITDKQFKKDLLKYLDAGERVDHVTIYSYLSKGYLKKYCPNIRNAEEYKNEQERAEIGVRKYLEITEWRKVNSDKYSVEIIFEGRVEGIVTRFKAIFYFVKEDGAWKFDDEEVMDSKIIEGA